MADANLYHYVLICHRKSCCGVGEVRAWYAHVVLRCVAAGCGALGYISTLTHWSFGKFQSSSLLDLGRATAIPTTQRRINLCISSTELR